MPSGAPPVLAEPVYWWNTRQAEQIRESIATYDPPAVLARRHAPQPLQEDAVDDTGVSANQAAPAADSLAGAAPLVEQTVRSVLEQHVASLTRKALDRRAGAARLGRRSSSSRSRRRSGSSPSWPTRPACTT